MPGTPQADRLFDDLVASFRSHLVGQPGGLDVAAMRALASHKKYRDYVLVPGEYPRAYRLMWKVPGDKLAQVIGREPGVMDFALCVRHDVGADDVNSWSVSLAALRRGERMFISEAEGASEADQDDGYAVLLIAGTAPRGRSRVFWLNPDRMYDAAEERWMAGEREVVSVGPVGPVVLSYMRSSGGHATTWDEMMDELLEDADGNLEYADELAACAAASGRARRRPLAARRGRDMVRG